MEHAISNHAYIYLKIFGKKIPFITDAVIVMWVVMAIIITAVFIMTRKITLIPGKAQGFGEMIIDFMNKFSTEQIGHHHAKAFMPYLTTLIMFLTVSNVIALINFIPSGEFLAKVTGNHALEHFAFSLHPPTRNLNVSLALALMSLIVFVYAEFRYKGVKGWAKGFYKPSPVFGFIKILDYITRPLSLCFRLLGNILGGLIIMLLIYGAAPILIPSVFGVYFDIFDGILQAYVFVFLTSLYIGEAVES